MMHYRDSTTHVFLCFNGEMSPIWSQLHLMALEGKNYLKIILLKTLPNSPCVCALPPIQCQKQEKCSCLTNR